MVGVSSRNKNTLVKVKKRLWFLLHVKGKHALSYTSSVDFLVSKQVYDLSLTLTKQFECLNITIQMLIMLQLF